MHMIWFMVLVPALPEAQLQLHSVVQGLLAPMYKCKVPCHGMAHHVCVYYAAGPAVAGAGRPSATFSQMQAGGDLALLVGYCAL